MKKNLAFLFTSLLLLSSCTMIHTDVNKAPEEYTPDHLPTATTSHEEITSEEESKESSGGLPTITVPSDTDTGAIVGGLTFDEAKPIIKGIRDYVSAHDPLATRYSMNKMFNQVKTVTEEGAVLPKTFADIDLDDTYVDFTNYQYQNHFVRKQVPLLSDKETISQEQIDYIYREEEESLNFVKASNDVLNDVKTYEIQTAASKEDVGTKFNTMTLLTKESNKNRSLLVLDLISGAKLANSTAEIYTIKSENEKSISCEIEFELTIKIPLPGLEIDTSEGMKWRIKVVANINDYMLDSWRLAATPKGFDYALITIKENYDYQPSEFVKPNLDEYTLKTQEGESNSETTTEETTTGQ